MASEIRVNTINNRSGLGTVSITDTGLVVSGIITATSIDTSSTSTFSSGLNVTGGSVGIGTDNPTHNLQVHGSFPDIAISDSDTLNDKFRILYNGGQTQLQIDPNNVGPNASHLLISIDGSEKFRIDSNGQIGLGGANYGSTGQVLTSNGVSSAPTWQDASGGDSLDVTASLFI